MMETILVFYGLLEINPNDHHRCLHIQPILNISMLYQQQLRSIVIERS